MQLTEQAIKEFQQLYQKEYGLSLSQEQAIDCGTKLIDFVRIVYGNNMPKSLDAIKRRGYDGKGDNFIKG